MTELDIQTWVGSARPTPERVAPVTNKDALNKPEGGLWTSTLADDGRSAWIEWCEREDYWTCSDPKVWALKPSDDVDVYHIDSERDVLRLPRTGGRFDRVDFERVFRRFDALHLTEQGQRATRFSSPKTSLYGWDCESTLWGGWHFEKVAFLYEL